MTYQLSPGLTTWAEIHDDPGEETLPAREDVRELKALVGYVAALEGPPETERGRLLTLAAETTVRWADANVRQVAGIDRLLAQVNGLKHEKADADRLVVAQYERIEIVLGVLRSIIEDKDYIDEGELVLAERLKAILDPTDG